MEQMLEEIVFLCATFNGSAILAGLATPLILSPNLKKPDEQLKQTITRGYKTVWTLAAKVPLNDYLTRKGHDRITATYFPQ